MPVVDDNSIWCEHLLQLIDETLSGSFDSENIQDLSDVAWIGSGFVDLRMWQACFQVLSTGL